MSNRMPEDLPDRMPEGMPEHMPEDMPDRMPDRMPEDMSDRMSEDVPVRKCINAMVGIIRSEVFFSVLHFLNIDNQDFIDSNFVQAKMLPVFYNQTRGSLFYFVDFNHGSTVHTYKMGFPTQTPSF